MRYFDLEPGDWMDLGELKLLVLEVSTSAKRPQSGCRLGFLDKPGRARVRVGLSSPDPKKETKP